MSKSYKFYIFSIYLENTQINRAFYFFILIIIFFFFYKTAINVISHESYLQDFLSVYVLCYRTSKWDWKKHVFNDIVCFTYMTEVMQKTMGDRERRSSDPGTARDRSFAFSVHHGAELSSAQLRLLSAPLSMRRMNCMHKRAHHAWMVPIEL